MSKAILIIDIDDELFENGVDIKNTQVTYIELECHNETAGMSLVNHWLKPLPQKKVIDYETFEEDGQKYAYEVGFNDCVTELVGEDE